MFSNTYKKWSWSVRDNHPDSEFDIITDTRWREIP